MTTEGRLRRFLRFLWAHKAWWLVPLVLVLVLLTVLVFVTRDADLPPFVYTLY